MNKIICMIFVCCLIYTQAFGVTLLGSEVEASGCSSGTAEISQTSNDANSGNINTRVIGQSFTLNTAISLYSITVSFLSGAESTHTLRIGTSPDLSKTYTEEISFTPDTGVTEILSASNPNLSTGTWYFGVLGDGVTSIFLRRNNSDVYTGGNYIYGAAGGSWNMSNLEPDIDLYFTINKCAE
ncbi:MAG: hypothetical protein KKE62_02035 [Proteobacteria bacterium]|nr:hypothetical protein [Pseudomonadota bacterium]MBU1387081.1 hypothetical protein [Pseudomonadota bacterium]MBU1541602.1 hypothetical protein [Pseudomonadota bacterium]MBU2431879.1 hypothetical protein [Pseudomonadota bacterium]MBU2479514.1 hypothetical protein [Pseudomonadota bacterium]